MTTKHNQDGTGETGFWDLIMDPDITPKAFQKTHREYHEHRAELDRVRARSLTRREFGHTAAGVGTAFALASSVAATPTGAKAGTSTKGVTKGTIRYGYINTLDCELLGYILEKKGIFESMGWDTKFLGAPSGPQVMEAFIADEIDFAYVGSNTPGVAAQKGVPSKHIVGGMVGHGGWAVRLDLYDQGITDFPKFFEYAAKRKADGDPVQISTLVPGTITHAACIRTIMDHGLDPEKDFKIHYLPPPEVAMALVTGQVDAQTICEQYDSYPEYFKAAKVIGHCLDSGDHMMSADGRDTQTYVQCVGVAARPGLPEEMILDVIEGHKKACEFMRDNWEETVEIATQISGTPAPVEWVSEYFRARWHYGLNYESVDSLWNDTMMKIGLGKKKFKLDELIDTHHALELKEPFEPITGVKTEGKVDVTSDAFRKRAWGEAMKTFRI